MKPVYRPGTCKFCLWFLQGQDGTGQCRALPPAAYTGPASHTRMVAPAVWPVVQNFDWCAFFKSGEKGES
jgi:hypothetical protein